MQKEEVILIINGLIKVNEKRLIHISLNHGRFYNGIILKFNEESLSFNDRRLGYLDLLYSQIINIEPFVER